MQKGKRDVLQIKKQKKCQSVQMETEHRWRDTFNDHMLNTGQEKRKSTAAATADSSRRSEGAVVFNHRWRQQLGLFSTWAAWAQAGATCFPHSTVHDEESMHPCKSRFVVNVRPLEKHLSLSVSSHSHSLVTLGRGWSNRQNNSGKIVRIEDLSVSNTFTCRGREKERGRELQSASEEIRAITVKNAREGLRWIGGANN